VQGGFSLWGHDRPYLSEEQRDTQRDMRLALAARGQRAPVSVPDCPWLQAVTAQTYGDLRRSCEHLETACGLDG